MDVCPLAKTGQELILDLVNAENNSEITVDQLMFGPALANEEGGNTALNLAAAPDSPWSKDVDVSYDRLDLNTLFHGQRAELSAPKGATKEDIVCHLNFTYDLKFTASEFDLTAVEDGELPELFKLKAKEGNLAYTGEMDIFVDLDRMPLSARLLKTDLNGFMYEDPTRPSWRNPVVAEGPLEVAGLAYQKKWTVTNADLNVELLFYTNDGTMTYSDVTKTLTFSRANNFTYMGITLTPRESMTLAKLMEEYDVEVKLGKGDDKDVRLPLGKWRNDTSYGFHAPTVTTKGDGLTVDNNNTSTRSKWTGSFRPTDQTGTTGTGRLASLLVTAGVTIVGGTGMKGDNCITVIATPKNRPEAKPLIISQRFIR